MAAISVDPPSDSESLAQRLDIDYPLLWDPDLQVALAFGVAMEGRDIAVPAVFVIDRELRIHWRDTATNAADRPSLSTILEQIDLVTSSR